MISTIHELRGALSPAERRVADYILDDPHQLARLRMADLAAASGVSDPTVVRFCRKIGMRGYDDLRLAVARELASRPGGVHVSVRDGDSVDVVLRKVLASSIGELQRVQSSLRPEALQRAANALLDARRIAFVGIGASAVVALDAHNKFFRLGLPTAAFTDGPTIAQAAATTTNDSVFVAISKSGTSSPVLHAVELARRSGAVTVALAASGSAVSDAAEIALSVDAEEDTTAFTPMGSRMAQLAALDALQVCTALAGGRHVRASLEASKRVLSET